MTAKQKWESENELATSMGFTCIPDHRRGGIDHHWCRFSIGQWNVWSIVSSVAGAESVMAWQVARVTPDGRHSEHYTRKHLKPGEYGISRCGIIELKDALEYAKSRHEEDGAK